MCVHNLQSKLYTSNNASDSNILSILMLNMQANTYGVCVCVWAHYAAICLCIKALLTYSIIVTKKQCRIGPAIQWKMFGRNTKKKQQSYHSFMNENNRGFCVNTHALPTRLDSINWMTIQFYTQNFGLPVNMLAQLIIRLPLPFLFFSLFFLQMQIFFSDNLN